MTPSGRPSTHHIAHRVLGGTTDVEISAEDFARYSAAKRNVIEALGIEEKYVLLIENYIEYERTLIELALDRVVYSRPDWSATMSQLHLVTRRLVNLLATSRLYLDQAPHALSTIFGSGSEEGKRFVARTNAEYDGGFAYRFMEALRNYGQHRSLPVNAIAYQGKAAGDGNIHVVKANLILSRVVDDGGLKAPVLKEARARGEYVDLTPMVREYVDALSRLHAFVREMLAGDLATCEATFEEVRRRYAEAHGGEPRALSVVRREGGRDVEHEDILEEFIARRGELGERSNAPQYLARNVVSAQRDDRA